VIRRKGEGGRAGEETLILRRCLGGCETGDDAVTGQRGAGLLNSQLNSPSTDLMGRAGSVVRGKERFRWVVGGGTRLDCALLLWRLALPRDGALTKGACCFGWCSLLPDVVVSEVDVDVVMVSLVLRLMRLGDVRIVPW
jgi:hypothetical protein